MTCSIVLIVSALNILKAYDDLPLEECMRPRTFVEQKLRDMTCWRRPIPENYMFGAVPNLKGRTYQEWSE